MRKFSFLDSAFRAIKMLAFVVTLYLIFHFVISVGSSIGTTMREMAQRAL